MKRSRLIRPMASSLLLCLVLPGIARAETHGDPANRLDFSRVSIHSLALQNVPARPTTLAGQVTLSVDQQEAVEVLFIGAPRWFNRFELRTDAAKYRIDVCSAEKDRTWVEFNGDVEQAADRILLSGPDTYARGVRFVPLSAPAGKKVVTVEMLGAAFYQLDPDDVKRGVISPMTEEGTKESHIGWSNDYPGTINDLTCSDNDAEELNDELPDDWTKWHHSDLNNYEVHYKSSSVGNGVNNNHTDAADLSFYAGHGITGTFMIGNDSEDDAYLFPSDAYLAWGDNDMEFLGSCACDWLTSSSRGSWADAMDGIHLICGSETVARGDPLYSYGGKWASKMKDSGDFDTAKTVKSSWFDAYEAENPAGNVAVVMGETSTQGDDYLWGEGSVSGDPTHDGSYTCWRYTASGLLAADMASPAVQRKAKSLTDPVVFSATGGLPITVDRSLLQSPATTMPYYLVSPVTVDTPYVRNLAQHICANDGVLCGGDIGPGDTDEINLIDGLRELRVSASTGSFSFEDSGRWMVWQTQAPTLPIPSHAKDLADQKLSLWGRLPVDAAFHSVRYLRQATVSHPQNEEVEDPQTSFPISIQVIYQRHLGAQQTPVEGGGGYMSVSFGNNGQLQRVFQPGWHPVTQGPPATIIPVQGVIQAISNRGTDATVDGIFPAAQSLTIDSWHLAYYEPPSGQTIQRLRPIYVFDATVHDLLGHDSATEIYAWADEAGPVAEITSPSEFTTAPNGSQVCVQGQFTGGAAPVVLTWRDDMGRDLGSGPSVCFTVQRPPVGSHSEGDNMRTITLTARDALGTRGTDRIRILVTPPTSGVGPDAPYPMLLGQNVPNPFRSSTRIAFHVPETGGKIPVTLRVFDVSGRLIATLLEANLPGGDHEVAWRGNDDSDNPVVPGVYFYEFTAGKEKKTRKLLLLK